MGRQVSLGCLALFFLGMVSGCVREHTDGPVQSFTYEMWVPLSVFLGGIVAAPVGWLIRNASSRLGWGLLIIGPIAAIFFAPSLFFDRAVIDESKFSVRTGIWGMTSVYEVKFDELVSVSIVSEEVRGRRGSKRTNYFLLCQRGSGISEKIPVNNNVSEAAAPHFLKRVAERGIPVLDET
jgi:hypothetical protein